MRIILKLFYLVSIGFLWGCSSAQVSGTPVTTPFFAPTSEDLPRLAVLRHDLDVKALSCLEASSCERVQFWRALISLFENQEAASASFRRVIVDNPSSDLAVSSRLWLQLIEDQGTQVNLGNRGHHAVVHLMAQLVREWMTRELAAHTEQKQASEITTQQPTVADSSAAIVRALQKQVRDRDRRIAILQSQMQDLKIIDQDQEKRKRTPRLPGTLP